jgi:hydrogenase maturation factor
MNHFDPAANPTPLESSASAAEMPKQNLPAALIAGVVGMLIGTAIWVGITVLTHFQIGYMAVGVGFLVGIMMRWAGRGYTPIFSICGAALAIVGCVLGNLLTGCVEVAKFTEVPFLTVLGQMNFDFAKGILQAGFSPIDILFYVFAALAGWKYSIYGND